MRWRAKLVLWSLWLAGLVEQPTAPVRVSSGSVRGRVAADGSHAAYLGIPYATLTKENRFQAPDPEPTWEGEYDAVNDKIMCHQLNLFYPIYFGQEHCLTINVYTPTFPSDTKFPVMVFIHGGGFIEGSGTPLLYGPNYLVPKGVVLVTFNYRLNAQGFIGLGIKEAPGNAGMKDQVTALKWVQKNIAVFGGDPDNVTIFGESAGGASVSYHLLSPMSKGLFHKAIIQSGSSLAAWAHQLYPENNAKMLAKTMGYTTEDPQKLYEVFKNAPPEKLVRVHPPKDEKKHFLSNLIFGPCIEKRFDGVEPFLTDDPYKLFSNGEYTKVPMIIGANDEEGYLFAGIEDPSFFSTMDIEHSLPNNLMFPSDSEKKRIAEEVKRMYMGDEPISNTSSAKIKISRFYGEPSFNYPSLAETDLILETSDQPVYHYLFKYDGWRNIGKYAAGLPFKESPGMAHADDLYYLFYQPFIAEKFEIEMIDRITTLWTNFAKYGDPTPTITDLLPVRWHPAKKGAPEAFVLDREMSTVPMWHRDSFKYWKDVHSKYRRK